MNYRFFHSPLLALALLAGTLGCSKQTDPAPALVTGTSSYELTSRQVTSSLVTSRQVNGQAHVIASQDAGYDFLEVQLTTTPQPASGPETLKLYFSRQTGQPTTAYQLDDIVMYDHAKLQGSPFENDVATIVATSNGGFSGTFSGTLGHLTGGFINDWYYTLEKGVFTNARP